MNEKLTSYSIDPQFKRIMSNVAGTLAESLALRILKSEGFEVARLVSNIPLKNTLDIRILGSLADYRSKLMSEDARVVAFIQEVESIFAVNWEKYAKGDKPNWEGSPLSGLPDLVARRDGDVYLIDVKTGKARMLPTQMKVFQLARKHGLKPYILNIELETKVFGASLTEANDENMEKLYPRKWRKLTTQGEAPQ